MENAECSHQKRICMKLFESYGDESLTNRPEEEKTLVKEDNDSDGNGNKIGFVIIGITKDILGMFDVPAADGETLYQLMSTAVEEGKMSFETVMTKWGRYITSIDGHTADRSKKQYWEIEDKGKPCPVGIDQYKPSVGTEIEFILTTWS